MVDVDVNYTQTSHDFIFGSYPPSSEPNAYLWRQANGGWIHFFISRWRDSNPALGVFDFHAFTSELDYLHRAYPNAQIVGQLFDLTPSGWLGTEPPKFVDFYNIDKPEVFRRYESYLYDYVFELVRHSGGRIRYWATQNELNRPVYAQAVRGLKEPLWTINQAFMIANVTTLAIRRANPDAFIILGGSVPNTTYDKDDWRNSLDPSTFAREAIRRGIEFDAFSIQFWHTVDRPAWLYDYLERVQSISKPVYIQEIGYPSQNLAHSPDEFGWKWTWNEFTEEIQTEWYRYVLTFAYGSSNVIGCSFSSYVDNPDVEEGGSHEETQWLFAHIGLLTFSGIPKKSYYMYKELLANFTTSGIAHADANGVATFRGFAGNYYVQGKGYEPVVIDVSEARSRNLTMTIAQKKTTTATIQTETIPRTETRMTTSAQLATGVLTTEVFVIVGLAFIVLAVVGVFYLWKRKK